jgi:GMP synthase-like glutamine amidotransferase
VQFHPEVTREGLEQWFVAAGQSIESAWGRRMDELRAELDQRLPEANRLGTELFRRFARQVKSRSERAA